MASKYLSVLFSAALCLAWQAGIAQSAPAVPSIESVIPVIDRIYRDFADSNHLPGFAYGLVANGKLLHTGYGGYTDVGRKIPVSAASAFRIASMTKSFTAAAILKLRDKGKLKLDEPVYQYIPEMKGQQYPVDDGEPVTIRQLLTHNAGFPEDNPWGDRQLNVSDEEMISMVKNGISFSNVPGIAYEYSNLGFSLLGHIIKKVGGQSYQQYIRDNMLAPLGMTHTYWNYPDVPGAQLAHGYRYLNDKWVEQPLLKDGAYGAMGGMITTMGDFSNWVQLQLSAWPARNEADKGPLKRSSLREMQKPWNFNQLVANYRYPGGRPCPLTTAYGYGLRWTNDCRNRTIVGHSGGLPGFGSDWKIMPEYGIGVIFFSNLTYTSGGNVNLQVLDTVIALAGLLPRKVPAPPLLEQRKNELIKLLPGWNNAESTGIFANNFFLDYFPDSLRKEAMVVFSKAGKILRTDPVVAVNYLRGSFLMHGENANIKVSFTLSPEKPALIQEYHISQQ
jgi:CubicO group peptidase (beta-lactamase class C family)